MKLWDEAVARSVVIHEEGIRLAQMVTAAAPLTNRPDLVEEIRGRWYIGTREGVRRRERGVYGLAAEDVVGILLVAHEEDPEQFPASLAADAAAVSAVVLRRMVKPSEVAASRWRQITEPATGN